MPYLAYILTYCTGIKIMKTYLNCPKIYEQACYLYEVIHSVLCYLYNVIHIVLSDLNKEIHIVTIVALIKVGLSLFYGNHLFTLFFQVIYFCINALSQNQTCEGSAKQVEEEIHYGEIDFSKRGGQQNPAMVWPQADEQSSDYTEINVPRAGKSMLPPG